MSSLAFTFNRPWPYRLLPCVLMLTVGVMTLLGRSGVCSADTPYPPAQTADIATPSRPEAERFAAIETYVEGERSTQGIPGLSGSILTGGRIVWSKGFGLADVEHEVPVTPITVFPLPGITRMMTATAVLQLVQEGRVALDTSIREFVPELPDKGAVITIYHVLSHTSGIRNFKDDEEYVNRKRYATMLDAMEPFRNDRLLFPPGTSFRLSAPAYNLLGLLIERVSGDSLEEYFRKRIFEPAGMKHSRVDRGRDIVLHRARGYSIDQARRTRNAPPVDLDDRLPTDGVLATADDVARFAQALFSNRLMERQGFERMMTPARTADDSEYPYGLGCFVREEGGHRIVGHGGRSPIASSFLLLFPDKQVAIVVLTNGDRADVQRLALGIAERLVDDFKPATHLERLDSAGAGQDRD